MECNGKKIDACNHTFGQWKIKSYIPAWVWKDFQFNELNIIQIFKDRIYAINRIIFKII